MNTEVNDWQMVEHRSKEQICSEQYIRSIYNMGYQTFCEVTCKDAMDMRQLSRWQLVQRNFIEGWFGLDDEIRAKLWNWARIKR